MERKDELPERLRQRTIETMQLDVPYVVIPEDFTGLEETVWIDTSNPENLALAIGKKEKVTIVTPDHHENDDLFVVMRVCAVNESGGLVEGLVADARACRAQFDEYNTQRAVKETDDTEALWDTMRVDNNKVRISAIVDEDRETGEVEYYGDPAFRAAANYLRQQVDNVFAEIYGDEAEKDVDNSPTGGRPKVKRLS